MPSEYHDKEPVRLGREHVCAECKSYAWRFRPVGGWAFCLDMGEWFPKQKAWARDELPVAPGKRTCPDWK